MPARGATMAAPAAPARQKGGAQQAPQGRAVLPFVRAAHEHVEGAFVDASWTPGSSTTNLGTFDVPAYGYIRNIWLLVTASGASAVSAAAASAGKDFPFNLLNDIVLTDINGAEIFHLPGYETYLSNLFGGYVWETDPTLLPDYNSTPSVPAFAIRIPVEITAWDGFGSLSNMNAAQALKLRLVGEASAGVGIWASAATIPAIRVRAYLEAWSYPAPQDLLGNPQEQAPPGHGTTQFWSRSVRTVNSGSNTFTLSRVGNLLRNVILVGRLAASGSVTGGRRTTALGDFPDPITLNWDARQLLIESPRYRRAAMLERFGVGRIGNAGGNTMTAEESVSGAPGARGQFPDGVYVYDFTHNDDGHGGYESRHLWLPSVEATRLELTGSFANIATLTVVTCDVAPQRGR